MKKQFKTRQNIKAQRVLSVSTETDLREQIEAVGGAAWCRSFRFNGEREDVKSTTLIEGGTLLHQCWEHWSEMLTRVLIQMGVPVNAGDANGNTLLHYVCRDLASRYDNSPDVYHKVLECKISLLVGMGADMGVTNQAGHTPIMLALKQRAPIQAMRMLVEHGVNTLHTRGIRGATIMHYACGGELTDEYNLQYIKSIVQILTDAGADFESKDTDGCTPLMWAVEQGSVPVVQTLLKFGMDVHTVDKRNASILHRAAMNAPMDMLQLFLEMGCLDIDAQDEFGFSVLHHCEIEMIPLVFQYGINMSTKALVGRDGGVEGLDALEYWKTQNDEIDFAELEDMWNTEMRRRKGVEAVAFAMGHHERLGAESMVRELETGVVRMILSAADKLPTDE